MRMLFIAVAVLGAGGLGFWFFAPQSEDVVSQEQVSGEAIVEIELPSLLSANASAGKTAFESVCADCHGINAVGKVGLAPPLVHIIYEPSHHADEAFQRAVALGVRGHHWPFGNMPPVEGLTRGDVAMIIAYVRELQVANGIE